MFAIQMIQNQREISIGIVTNLYCANYLYPQLVSPEDRTSLRPLAETAEEMEFTDDGAPYRPKTNEAICLW